MKQIKKILSLATALILCLVPLFGNTMIVNAAGEPTTYYIKYVESLNEWRWQTNGWVEGQYPNGLSTLSEYIKDGDHIAVDGSYCEQAFKLDVNINLSSLTFTSTKIAAIVNAKSVDTVYGVNGALGIVNAPVKTAYVYDNALLQFNEDVEYLEIISSKGDILHATVGTNASVKHVKAYSPSYVHFEFYDFAKGALSIVDGHLKSAEGTYSKTPVASTPAPSTPAAPSGEYDDVPKTGDIRFNPLWLVALAAVCFAGSYALKKEK